MNNEHWTHSNALVYIWQCVHNARQTDILYTTSNCRPHFNLVCMDTLFIKANSINAIFREIGNKIVWNIDAFLHFWILWLWTEQSTFCQYPFGCAYLPLLKHYFLYTSFKQTFTQTRNNASFCVNRHRIRDLYGFLVVIQLIQFTIEISFPSKSDPFYSVNNYPYSNRFELMAAATEKCSWLEKFMSIFSWQWRFCILQFMAINSMSHLSDDDNLYCRSRPMK